MSDILCINITSRTESKVLIPYHETNLCYTPPKINEVLLQVYKLWAKKYIGLEKKNTLCRLSSFLFKVKFLPNFKGPGSPNRAKNNSK